jgi:hypothetical protein
MKRLDLWWSHQSAARVAAMLFLLFGIFVSVVGYAKVHGSAFDLNIFVQDFYANLGVELLSIAVTVLIVDRLNDRQTMREHKGELIVQMGSPDHAFAIEAVRIMRLKGWLTDGSLRGHDFSKADLHEADLTGADLQGAKFFKANLDHALLSGANLQFTSLGFASLKDATLVGANLEHAHLGGANLENADLRDTDLIDAETWSVNAQGANLRGAKMSNVRLRGAKLDEHTTLPCGKKWKSDTDLRQYTDEKHPEFVDRSKNSNE